MKTVLEVLQATTKYFGQHAVENPRLNAEHLLAHALGKKRLDLYLEFDRPLAELQLAPLRELVRERAKGRPLQHLLGTVDFLGRIFRTDARALIPRPETEQLVTVLLGGRDALATAHILDVGTGSGVIALTLAAELPAARVEAGDLSAAALALAAENAAALGLAGRVVFHECDLLPAGAAPGDRFDLIVANLPYVAADAMGGLSREVAHDPPLALDGGPGGTAVIERLLAAAPARLAAGGRLALEIGGGQADYLVEKMAGLGYQGVERKPDYQGIDRFLFATYG